jgi:hypothetical protein
LANPPEDKATFQAPSLYRSEWLTNWQMQQQIFRKLFTTTLPQVILSIAVRIEGVSDQWHFLVNRIRIDQLEDTTTDIPQVVHHHPPSGDSFYLCLHRR